MVATSIGKRTASNGSNGNGVSTLEFEFHSPDIDVPQDVVRYTQDKLTTRLAKFGRRVMGVLVHIKDLNGPKGGVGLLCHMEARLAHLEPVNVEEKEPDLRAAIDVAIDRLEVVVGRHVEKARKLPRVRGRKLVRNQKSSSP
jgi:ribosome-associated translation inhibitor RaiA